jgi:hypothetical protein
MNQLRLQAAMPAGMRLLCVLLFGNAGALGLLLVSWLVCFFHFFPDDTLRSCMGGILAAAAPWLANRIAQQAFCLRASLALVNAMKGLLSLPPPRRPDQASDATQ